MLLLLASARSPRSGCCSDALRVLMPHAQAATLTLVHAQALAVSLFHASPSRRSPH